ncbi:MAG: hypothetical protein RL362_1375 [Bacteroidota bacterium]|jgi:hypothetical protein
MDTIAWLLSLLIFFAGYSLSFIFCAYHFSNGIISEKLRQNINPELLNKICISLPVLTPLLTSFVFLVCAYIDHTVGLYWGYELKFLVVSETILCFLLILLSTVPFLFTFIKPYKYKFENRRKVIYLFLLHHVFVISIAKCVGIFVPIFAFLIPSINQLGN